MRISNMSGIAQSLFSRIQGVFNGSPAARIGDDFATGSMQLSLSPKHRRIFDKIVKLMDDVCKACQSPRLNLKNSPPFILDILPETYQLLIVIFTKEPDILCDNEYLRVFMENLQYKCKAVLKLFRTTAVFDDKTTERRNLTKYSLIFSHMLSELKAEFPGGIFIGPNFRITKKEAAVFWRESFQDQTLVTWAQLHEQLNKSHPIGPLEASSLRATIDLTGNDHVSNFEFDVFTRLFYPWKSLLRNWQTLTTAHPGYVAFLTYDEVKKQLERLHNKPGSYVFRLSCTRLGQWAIGYVAPDGKIYQTIPQNKSLIQALIEGAKEGFYLYPNGQTKDIDLTTALEPMPADRIKVTSDQYEIYCEMGTTFELCKICDDNDKNIKLEPCGHLLCQPCLNSWQDSSEGGNTCPFCRYEIKGTSKVIIESFAPNAGDKLEECEKELIDWGEPPEHKKNPKPMRKRTTGTRPTAPPTEVGQQQIQRTMLRNPPFQMPRMGARLARNSSAVADVSRPIIHTDDVPVEVVHNVRSSVVERPQSTTTLDHPPSPMAPPIPPRKESPTSEAASLPVAPPPPLFPRQSQLRHDQRPEVIYVNVGPDGAPPPLPPYPHRQISHLSPAYVNTSIIGSRSTRSIP